MFVFNSREGQVSLLLLLVNMAMSSCLSVELSLGFVWKATTALSEWMAAATVLDGKGGIMGGRGHGQTVAVASWAYDVVD